jgi:hypothetical protein
MTIDIIFNNTNLNVILYKISTMYQVQSNGLEAVNQILSHQRVGQLLVGLGK